MERKGGMTEAHQFDFWCSLFSVRISKGKVAPRIPFGVGEINE
jgi:hypothetical protein